MKKFFIQIFFLLVLVFGATYFGFAARENFVPEPSAPTNQKALLVKGIRLNIEVAQTPEERKQGLGGRQSLASDSGMLFIFPEEKIHTFWMKGLSFPLDFIWIRSGKVVDITKNAQPPAPGTADQDLPIYVPREPVTRVLEVNAGFVDTFGIKIGDRIEEIP
jgi:uncharacterized protein